MFVLLLTFLLSLPIQSEVQPDRWRGLVVNEASPDDAITALGKPEKDSTEQLRIFDIDSKWITEKQKQKIYRRLEFKPEGMKKAALFFADGKLIMIELYPAKEPQAAALSNIYGLQFIPRISSIDQALSPRDYERHEGRVYPKNYPTVYSLAAVHEKVFVGAMVGNVGFGSALRNVTGVPDGSSFPGKVGRIQIISRKLENLDGADALK